MLLYLVRGGCVHEARLRCSLPYGLLGVLFVVLLSRDLQHSARLNSQRLVYRANGFLCLTEMYVRVCWV